MISLHTPPGTKIIYAPRQAVRNIMRPHVGCPLTAGSTYVLAEWREFTLLEEPELVVEGFPRAGFWRGFFHYAELPRSLTSLLNVAPIKSDRELADAPCDTETTL